MRMNEQSQEQDNHENLSGYDLAEAWYAIFEPLACHAVAKQVEPEWAANNRCMLNELSCLITRSGK